MGSVVKSSSGVGKKRKVNISLAGKYALLLAITVLVFLPLLIIINTAFKTPAEVNEMTPLALPRGLNLENLVETFQRANIALALANTLLVALTSVALNIILGAMASYVIARFDFRFKKIVVGMFLAALIIPFYTIEVARFTLIRDMGLYNTLAAPILIYVGADMMQIFVYKQFIDKVSVSLDECAMIEGASFLRIFTTVIFPLIVPAAATLGIIKFVDITNDMYIPYLYIPSSSNIVLSTALMLFAGEKAVSWSNIAAAIIWIVLPTLVVYLLFNKYVLAGITAGAVKE